MANAMEEWFEKQWDMWWSEYIFMDFEELVNEALNQRKANFFLTIENETLKNKIKRLEERLKKYEKQNTDD